MKVCIIGKRSFIAQRISRYLQLNGIDVDLTGISKINTTVHYDCTIYCIGKTANFNTNKSSTISAHVNSLMDVLKTIKTTKFIYLSSLRIFDLNCESLIDENTLPIVDSQSERSLYDLSKLLGEQVVRNEDRVDGCVLRLCNIYAYSENAKDFLSKILIGKIKEPCLISGIYRNYIHVNVLCELLLAMIKADYIDDLIHLAANESVDNITLSEFLKEQGIKNELKYGESTITKKEFCTKKSKKYLNSYIPSNGLIKCVH